MSISNSSSMQTTIAITSSSSSFSSSSSSSSFVSYDTPFPYDDGPDREPRFIDFTKLGNIERNRPNALNHGLYDLLEPMPPELIAIIIEYEGIGNEYQGRAKRFVQQMKVDQYTDVYHVEPFGPDRFIMSAHMNNEPCLIVCEPKGRDIFHVESINQIPDIELDSPLLALNSLPGCVVFASSHFLIGKGWKIFDVVHDNVVFFTMWPRVFDGLTCSAPVEFPGGIADMEWQPDHSYAELTLLSFDTCGKRTWRIPQVNATRFISGYSGNPQLFRSFLQYMDMPAVHCPRFIVLTRDAIICYGVEGSSLLSLWSVSQDELLSQSDYPILSEWISFQITNWDDWKHPILSFVVAHSRFGRCQLALELAHVRRSIDRIAFASSEDGSESSCDLLPHVPASSTDIVCLTPKPDRRIKIFSANGNRLYQTDITPKKPFFTHPSGDRCIQGAFTCQGRQLVFISERLISADRVQSNLFVISSILDSD